MKDFEYNKMAIFEQYYWWYVGLHNLIYSVLKKYTSNPYILDAGCGTGGIINFLSQKNYKVRGFDISDKALKLAQNKGINCLKADIRNFKFSDKFDVIISTDVICSVPEYEIQILNNFYNHLKKNGLLIINLPAFPILKRNHDLLVNIKKRYLKNDVKKLLLNTGFKIQLLTYRLMPVFFIAFIKKIIQKTFSLKPVSDLSELPNFLNTIFLKYHLFENFFIIKKFSIPFGTSVFAVAKKE